MNENWDWQRGGRRRRADAPRKLRGLKLGFPLNFGANLMKDGIERNVNGLPEENLGVLASLRETKTQVEPGGAATLR
jgi:hypothetical protein